MERKAAQSVLSNTGMHHPFPHPAFHDGGAAGNPTVQRSKPGRRVLLLWLGLSVCVVAAHAQHGSPFANNAGWLASREGHVFTAMGGLSLVGARWHGAGSGMYEGATRRISARLRTTLRAGVDGATGRSADEWYDLLRAVEDVRPILRQNHPVKIRVGLIEDFRLGTGHIVNFFSSTTAWDDRTVGSTVSISTRVLQLTAFTDNLLLNGVSGGHVAVLPFTNQSNLASRSTALGFSLVEDRYSGLRGYSTDLQFDLFETASIHFAPFASYAWYDNLGDGLAIGSDLYSHGFLGLISFGTARCCLLQQPRVLSGIRGIFL